jgi:hypothetical protein
MSENTERAIKNGQSRDTGNIGYTGQNNIGVYRQNFIQSISMTNIKIK